MLGPEEGESFWQPLPSTGYVINKFNPYNSPYDTFSTGLQVLEPGAHVRRHAHERSHELLFCYRGTGQADIEGELHDIRPESMILIGRGLQHKVTNTGMEQMRLLWLITPPGLEVGVSDCGQANRLNAATRSDRRRPPFPMKATGLHCRHGDLGQDFFSTSRLEFWAAIFRMLSPLRSRRCALWTRRSRTASAMVGSAITSCQ